MAKFTLDIGTDGSAFDDYPGMEVARILRGAAEVIEKGSNYGTLKDTNGNTVGSYSFEGDE